MVLGHLGPRFRDFIVVGLRAEALGSSGSRAQGSEV